MAQFFINRPVFAWVLAIITMLFGAWGIQQLPIAQYPEVAPTTIRISASYSGAPAEAVENAVTTPIENGLSELEGLLYMVSQSSQGRATVTLTFDDSIDADMAQIQVQNRMQSITNQLPDSVQSNGVTVSRSTDSILMVAALVSNDGSYTTLQLGDMMNELIEPSVTRVDGVGGLQAFGTSYAMRIWLDPFKLVQYQMTPSDITSAISSRNATVTVGSLGSQPVVPGQQFSVSMTAQSQLTSPEEFQRILLRTNSDGSHVYLGDVARVEIGQESYGQDSRFNGKPAAGFGVNLSSGANAVDTAENVRHTLEGLQNALPEGVEIAYAYDTSPFVEESIEKVYHTLAEAVILVFLVILIFLQSWRATLIPTLAVPVVVLGTFGVLSLFGMSINTLTMFALVLAIGLLVDDAIVVVENVERVMEEEGLDARAATRKSMHEITPALVGIVTVLSAVFLPMAFMAGSTGVIYRQFSVTIISAMVLSLFVALILTPALCATLLKPQHGPRRFPPARWFNSGLAAFTNRYAQTNRWILKLPVQSMVALAAITGALWYFYDNLPSSFIPQEDQGVLMAMISLNDGATTAQTEKVLLEVEDYLLNEESATVDAVFANLGFSFGGSGQGSAMLFVKLRPFDDRHDHTAASLVQRATARFSGHRAGNIFFMQPPAMPALGNSSGFSMYLVDQGANGQEALLNAAADLNAAATASGAVNNIRGGTTRSTVALNLDVDQLKAAALGISVSDVNAMLATIFTGRQVNDFAFNGTLRPVMVQGQADYRMQADDVMQWNARNSSGEMVPFSAFMTQKWEVVPTSLARFGGSRAVSMSGSPATDVSSGAAMAAMEEMAADLDGGYGVAWTGLSYQERQSGTQAPLLFALSALVVFLCLAALYESWSVPLAVLLAAPIGALGALGAALLFDQSNDVYFKVGLLATIGLASRNAILIVEFAKERFDRGMDLKEAAIEAARLRLRPILMTSIAFMLGVLPLAIADGAGAAAQHAIGIGVLGGMVASTVIGIFLVPAFYVVVTRLFGSKRNTLKSES
ncbi:aminoglycoside efflux pump [Ketogulonicigenium robustum]|uniref:Efflux pump membrane transporter n=1 Tax=Ketogulonicigenium robustum TaxID=92947 RepID=A0A1W6NWS7_9RHOB|nr:multidrug efflux RND transporter permease subunit [Ketogulonicigenium robustum]ARO13560.1 aminoglycoside efflux pump [Ketogulonicigenium robustum]